MWLTAARSHSRCDPRCRHDTFNTVGRELIILRRFRRAGGGGEEKRLDFCIVERVSWTAWGEGGGGGDGGEGVC